MQMRTIVVFLVGCAAAIWAGLLYISGTQLGWDMARPFSLVTGCVTALALLFEIFLWRLPLVRSLIARPPSIAGTWRTVLQSNFPQADGSETVKIVFVVIHQSLTRLSVRMYSRAPNDTLSVAGPTTTPSCGQRSVDIGQQTRPWRSRRRGGVRAGLGF